ncbi:hypothetical protein NQ318_020833 [Aromia moschata]|uniref:Uncharacterized protein n=1 Tax=Aromia moschata TaxID=1265417 RepID=A0AAV8X3K6_9CUCU|nr:hypothetical protein NQ318_020833 [Aromia moschata]
MANNNNSHSFPHRSLRGPKGLLFGVIIGHCVQLVESYVALYDLATASLESIYSRIHKIVVNRVPTFRDTSQALSIKSWVVAGPISHTLHTHTPAIVCNLATDTSINENLQKFWRLEEIQPDIKQTPDEKKVRSYFYLRLRSRQKRTIYCNSS